MSDDPDALVTLMTAENAFVAHTIVATLREAGIEAFAFNALQTAMPLHATFAALPIQVRAADLKRARDALKQNIADSVDLDWEQVDVGEREDSLPLRQTGRVPVLPRVGQIIALILLLIGLAALLRWAVGLLW